MRSTRSRGMSLMVEAVSGEGRMGRVGLVSTLKDRMSETESECFDPALAWWCASALNGEGELGDRLRLMLAVERMETLHRIDRRPRRQR